MVAAYEYHSAGSTRGSPTQVASAARRPEDAGEREKQGARTPSASPAEAVAARAAAAAAPSSPSPPPKPHPRAPTSPASSPSIGASLGPTTYLNSAGLASLCPSQRLTGTATALPTISQRAYFLLSSPTAERTLPPSPFPFPPPPTSDLSASLAPPEREL